jgi:uncharacterized protein
MTSIFIGAGEGGTNPQALELSRANRHGLIAGATGTGKTVTLQRLVEGFSRAGVACFVADVKGDLSGLAMPGSPTGKMHPVFQARAAAVGDTAWAYADTPVQFWDLYGEQGHPVRATVSEMGPLLLARLLNLTEVQAGVLDIAFHVADADGLLLLDLDDLQAMLTHCAERAKELTTTYGNVSKQSVGAIQRALLQLRTQGAEHFFGEPALDVADLFGTDEQGRGLVNVLAADTLMASPKLYATFLLWLLSELWETLPEVGDLDKPKLMFFFDEAHLLFDDAPDALLTKIEQVVRLIRSKGVGVFFITQNPLDIPDKVAGQLGNRVQHALRAFTPRDQAAVRAAAETFRVNPGVDVATAITELKVGEALVSLLQPDGAPSPVCRTLIAPPGSRVGPVTVEERRVLIGADAVGDRYDEAVDRHSAEEMLAAKAGQAEAAAAEREAADDRAREDASRAKEEARLDKERARARAAEEREAQRDSLRRTRYRREDSLAGKMATSAARSASSSLGRQVANEIGGAVFGTRSRRRSSGGGLGGALLRGVLGGLFR